MKISINKVHFPVTTLGYGRRLGIWVQGCSIRCEGCLSKDTWARCSEYDIAIDRFLASCRNWIRECDGVTISGGEPFDQPEALAHLLSGIRDVCRGDILVYSGYSHRVLIKRHQSILEHIDVLISGPFMKNKSASLVLRGSDNQRISLLTPLARECYPIDIDRKKCDKQRMMDLQVFPDRAFMAGIPAKGAMADLRAKMKALGFGCKTTD